MQGLKVFAALLVLSFTGMVQAQEKASSVAGLEADELAQLLSRESSDATRQVLMGRLVASAQAGDGEAAFTLGALYRHGMDHPAQLVERDAETARFWLEKCVDSERCPLFALASLAELELAAGNPKPAMQWAQAWVILERELDKRMEARAPRTRIAPSPYQGTAYHAYLIGRCYKAMPNTRDPGALGMSWFDELRAARAAQLDRMLFAALDPPSGEAAGEDQGPRLEISAENQRTKSVDAAAPQPVGPALGLYLYRGAPQGGRAESIWLIDALPSLRSVRGLDMAARSLRTKPYSPMTPEQRAYAYVPISFDDGQHSLVPNR